MEIEEGEIVEEHNVENVKVAADSRKRTSEGGIDSVATKRMVVDTESGVALSNNLNSVETEALQERVMKLERLYQRACRTTREVEIRAERAEKIIEDMQAVGSAGVSASKAQAVVKHEMANINAEPNNNPPMDNSAEFAELQEKVKKLERMFEGACRTAREAELRAERAEKIIDTKQGIKESVDKKDKEIEELRANIVEMGKKLVESTRLNDLLSGNKERDEQLRRDNEGMMREIDHMRGILNSVNCPGCYMAHSRQAGLVQENDAMRWEIANMRRFIDNGCQTCGMLRQENEAMKWEMSNMAKRLNPPPKKDCANCAVLGKRINDLQGRISEASKKSKKCDDCGHLNKKIRDLNQTISESKKDCQSCSAMIARNTTLNRKITELDKKLKEKNNAAAVEEAKRERAARSIARMNILVEPEPIAPVVHRTTADILAELATVESSGNFDDIWTPCPTRDIDLNLYVDAYSASKVLKYKYNNECNQPAFLKMLKDDMIRCCGKLFIKSKFIVHFCSNRHNKQMKKRGSSRVSKAALATWIDAMEASRSAGDARIEEEETLEDREIQWIEAVEESGTVEDAESFQSKRKREEAFTKEPSFQSKRLREKALREEHTQRIEGSDTAKDAAAESFQRKRGRTRKHTQRIEAIEESETAKDAAGEDEEAPIEAMEESGTAENAPVEDEQASPIEEMEEIETIEDAIVEEETPEASPIEEMEEIETVEYGEDETGAPEAPANGGEGEAGGAEEEVPHFQAPAENNGGFFSWMIGAFTKSTNEGEKENKKELLDESETGKRMEEGEESGVKEQSRVMGKRERLTPMRSLMKDKEENAKRWTNRREMVTKMIGPHMKKTFDK